jgi:hypothetical protein
MQRIGFGVHSVAASLIVSTSDGSIPSGHSPSTSIVQAFASLSNSTAGNMLTSKDMRMSAARVFYRRKILRSFATGTTMSSAICKVFWLTSLP